MRMGGWAGAVSAEGEQEEDWKRFKRLYMANIEAVTKRRQESEKRVADAAAKEAAAKAHRSTTKSPPKRRSK